MNEDARNFRKPSPLLTFFVCLLVIAIGLAMFDSFLSETKFVCARTANSGRCVYETKRLILPNHEELPIESFRKAIVEPDTKNPNDCERLVLLRHTGNNIIFASDDTLSCARKQELANRINSFLSNSSEATLEVSYTGNWLLLPLGIIFVVAGALGLFQLFFGSRRRI